MMSKNTIRYEDDSQDNQETVYAQNSQDDFSEDEAKEYNPLLIVTEAVGEVVGSHDTERLAKAIIRAVKKGKMERLGKSSPYAILFEGRLKLLSVYKGKEGVAIIPLNQDIIRQIREYC